MAASRVADSLAVVVEEASLVAAVVAVASLVVAVAAVAADVAEDKLEYSE